MSDPLSVSASIGSLLALTAQIAGKAGGLCNSVKDAPESLRQIQEEMDEMNRIFCQVRLSLGGTTRPNTSRLAMISVHLHYLSTTLSGCVLLCSNLNTKLNEVSGTGKQRKGTELIKERIKLNLWTEAVAGEIIEDLQLHKLCLNLILSIIQW